ncbi:GNAT family N-acetyltransferase [Streptomyces sp. T028]|uniref:GNAT family N-acetyltransferase n=1 Tax=Streptomyces sp. T028 TaxID=3394379 RepID=UPI003A852496
MTRATTPDTDRLRLRQVPSGEGSREAARTLTGAHPTGTHRPGRDTHVLVRDEGALVLDGTGFHRPPTGGAVETGFDPHPDSRGRGRATEAPAALAHRAPADPGVDTVVATTTHDHTPSPRALERIGFARRPDRGGPFVHALIR